MNITVGIADVLEGELENAAESGPALKRTVVAFGFWIFLLSDIVMFSALFAGYAVLAKATAGSPARAQLFDQRNVAMETAFLLLSSYTCGLMSLAANSRRSASVVLAAVATFILGPAFLISKFANFRPW
jgi:cytochrome o ubiquinol oxidase subunit 3